MTDAAAMSRAPAAVNHWFIAPLVAMAAFMEVMDISVANVALPHIAGALGASQDESTWVLTSYLATNAISMPISGWLSNRFGRKRFFLACIAGFTVSSLLCGLAPNLVSLMVLRALQGAAGGGLQPMGQAILADSFPPEKRGMATALYGIAAVVAPIVGPVLGGWITDSYDWRWIFLINVPIGIVLLSLISSLLPESGADRAHAEGGGRVDGWGFAFIALTLGCLQIVLDRGQEDDWFASGSITMLTIIAALSLVLLVRRELRHENPMIDLRMFASREFTVAFAMMAMLGFSMNASTFILPAYAQSLMGYSAMDAGLVIGPAGLALVVIMPIVGKLVNKVDLRVLIAIGLVSSGLATWWMTNFYLGISFKVMMLARVAQMAGVAFLFIPINTIVFRSVPPTKTNNASALVNLARNFGGSIGLTVTSVLLTRRGQFHQSRLVEHLQSMNPAYPDFATQLGGLTGGAAEAPSTLATLYQSAMEQASLLSYLDTFKVLAWVFLASLPLILLVKRGKGGAAVIAH
jgi:DHA2 family multidrug resistance protein